MPRSCSYTAQLLNLIIWENKLSLKTLTPLCQQVGLNIEVAVCRLYCRCCRLVIVIAYFEQLFASIILIAGHRRLMLHHLPPLFASPALARRRQARQSQARRQSPSSSAMEPGVHRGAARRPVLRATRPAPSGPRPTPVCGPSQPKWTPSIAVHPSPKHSPLLVL